MKAFNRIQAGVLGLLLVLGGVDEAQAQDQPPAARSIRVEMTDVQLRIGETFSIADLNAVALDAGGNVLESQPITMRMGGRVATLSGDGTTITADRPGEATLTLTAVPQGGGGARGRGAFQNLASTRVSVRVLPDPVATLSVMQPDVGYYTGTVVSLGAHAATAAGDERADAVVTWTSSNSTVARVDDMGNVYSMTPGSTTITAMAEGVSATLPIEVMENAVDEMTVTPANTTVRTGDVVRFQAMPSADGQAVTDIAIAYTVAGGDNPNSMGASIYPDGAFVAARPGTYMVTANAGGVARQTMVEVEPRNARMDVEMVGAGLVTTHPTSDLWVFEGVDGRDYAYLGTHSGGQKMFAWDVTDPANPVLTDSIVVDARVVNDVKVNEDATLAVITREGASDRQNGIVVLDLSDPAHPTVLSEYTETLSGGVHNTFISGDIAYAVHNGTRDVHIISLSDPENPAEVGRWGLDVPGKSLHDIWEVDGLLYVSYWNDGIWILDVGDGRWGGTPSDPVPVSSYSYIELSYASTARPEGQANTHVAFPFTNSDGRTYLFVGDEIFGCIECTGGARGFIHIFDMEDPENLEEVARYEVPEAGTHNIWVEDDKLYVAYYQGGLRVVDISGELRGNLYDQGREVAWFPTTSRQTQSLGGPNAWGPQPYKGNVFVSDMNSGLWIVKLVQRNVIIP